MSQINTTTITQAIALVLIGALLAATMFTPRDNAYAAWYDGDWTYRVKLEINPSQVSTTSSLTSFPVYVDLADMPASFRTAINSGGSDIRVTESDEVTETPVEIVSASTTAAAGEIHFLADSLSGTATTTFYIYYGNIGTTTPPANSTYGRNAVWTNYTAVWHLEDIATSTTALDSTGNGYDLTSVGSMTDSDWVAGQLGNGVDFDGSNDALTETSFATLGASGVTLQSWAKVADTLESGTFIGVKNSAGSAGANVGVGDGQLDVDGNDMVAGIWGKAWVGTADALGTGWNKVDMLWESGGTRYYLNGTQNHTDASTVNTGANIAQVGGDNIRGDYGAVTVDEARVIESELGSDWIATEYNNQSSPSTFYWVGSQEEDAGGGGGGGGATTTPVAVFRGDIVLQGDIVIQ